VAIRAELVGPNPLGRLAKTAKKGGPGWIFGPAEIKKPAKPAPLNPRVLAGRGGLARR
ncbi:hypothetical protein PIB30_050800, partial [Stylosanthes scabra]|nr:hypothetical protein [Stylosanthes scabra]